MNYYNEWDPFAAAWLRNLIAAGLLLDGDVDERSITDVQPADLEGYTQHHFFAGIGGWPLALQLAGWPSDGVVFTGSCPCQPFSIAGRGGGTADSRHLWPQFHRLIAECRPPVVFGEQVASLDGRGWLAGVRTDLESVGYAVGAADLCAASLGAPHIRSRLWWVADSTHVRHEWARSAWGWRNGSTDSRAWADSIYIECADGKTRRIPNPETQPSVHPLAHGVPNRVGRLRAYGNAIVPQVAATFIRAFMQEDSR